MNPEDETRALAELAKVIHPKLDRGQVWCRTCGRTRRVDSAKCLRRGWPKCCGFTMTIDSPEEQAALATQEQKP